MSVKRFNYALDNVWYANEVQYKADYLKSIVFIHKSNGDGVAIYAHGSYFPTDVNLNNFNELVNNLLLEGNNITITPTIDAQGKITDLKIGAVSLSSLTSIADADKTKLVEAQAVADAFAGVNSALIYDPTTANADSYTFQQEFTNLKGEKISPKTPIVKITAGDNVSLDANATDGLIISTTANTYSISATTNETDKVNLNLYTNDTVPIVDKVTFTGSGDTSVSLSGNSDNEVITINATPYTGKQAISVDQSLVENAISKEIKLIIDPTDVVLTQSDAGLKTNLELWYNSSGEAYNNQYDEDANGIKFKENHIYLLGKNKDAIPYIVSEFDATSFVKDSFLSDVLHLVITGEETEGEPGYGANVEPGKYIAFYFTTIERDNQGNVDDIYSQQVIYLNVKDFYTPVLITGDTVSYSVADKSTGADGSDVYTVKNTLGTISRNNSANIITVSKAGLATVGDIKTVLETISSVESTDSTVAGEGEVTVVTAVKQEKGRVEVTTDAAATKTYVDDKFGEIKHNTVSAPKAEGKENYATVTSKINADSSTNYEVVVSGIDNAIATATVTGTVVNQGTNGVYNFVEINKGLMTTDVIASLMNEAWAWGTI